MDVSLHELDSPFSEEVIEAINSMPSENAPGPDGFTGLFFKNCWGSIKHDLMRVIQRFDSLHTTNLHWLNYANIVLLPKKDGGRASLTLGPLASSMQSPRSSRRCSLSGLARTCPSLSPTLKVRSSKCGASTTTSCMLETLHVACRARLPLLYSS